MNWDKFLILAGQIVVVIVLGALVATGHNNGIQSALLAVCGSIAGLGLYQTVAARAVKPPPE